MGKKNLLNEDEFNLEEELKDKVQSTPTQAISIEIESSTKKAMVIDNTIKVEEPKEQDKKYMRLDVTDYQEYISLIAEYKNVSMTNYIQSLIKTDMQVNKNTYDKLKQVKQMMANI